MAKKIVIDAGHGGRDPGAKNGTYKEKQAALGIILELGLLLYRGGYEVYYTRTNDTYVSLPDRCSISNKAKADAFVSVHLNASTGARAVGIETWRYAAVGSKTKQLAAAIQENLIDATGANNRGVKETDSLYVLKQTKAPAVLVECGFISNGPECRKLFTTDYQRKIAQAIYRGIKEQVK